MSSLKSSCEKAVCTLCHDCDKIDLKINDLKTICSHYMRQAVLVEQDIELFAIHLVLNIQNTFITKYLAKKPHPAQLKQYHP